MPVAQPGDGGERVEIRDTAQLPQLHVLIAAGDRLLRAGLAALLEADDGFSVVAEAGTVDEAVTDAVRVRPDVVLMAAAGNGPGWIEATQRILAVADAAVLLLLAGTEDDQVFPALRAGARPAPGGRRAGRARGGGSGTGPW